MTNLQVVITDESRRVRCNRLKMLRLVRGILRRRMPRAIVDIAIVGSRRIAALNRQFLRRSGVTDVISFNLGPVEHGLGANHATSILGQIVVCADVARREARKRRIRAEDELALYIAHGALHLLGETDYDPEARERMRRLAAKALVKGGYSDVTGGKFTGRGAEVRRSRGETE
jgi:probable rRNA maturation factor